MGSSVSPRNFSTLTFPFKMAPGVLFLVTCWSPPDGDPLLCSHHLWGASKACSSLGASPCRLPAPCPLAAIQTEFLVIYLNFMSMK